MGTSSTATAIEAGWLPSPLLYGSSGSRATSTAGHVHTPTPISHLSAPLSVSWQYPGVATNVNSRDSR